MDSKKVSIIVPVYNNEKTIQRCLDSLFAQTYENIEIIIVDDGSKDDTSRIIDKNKGRSLVYIKQKNKGVSAARNCGIHKSSGDYLMFADADDTYESCMVSEMVRCAQKHKVKIVKCSMRLIGPKTEIEGLYDISNKKINYKDTEAKNRLMKLFFYDNANIRCSSPTLLVDASLIKKKGVMFNEQLIMMEDTDYYLHLFKLGENMFFLDKPLYNYYNNPESATRAPANYERMAKGIAMTNASIRAAVGVDGKIEGCHFKLLFRYSAMAGKKSKVLEKYAKELAENAVFVKNSLFWRITKLCYIKDVSWGVGLMKKAIYIKSRMNNGLIKRG